MWMYFCNNYNWKLKEKEKDWYKSRIKCTFGRTLLETNFPTKKRRNNCFWDEAHFLRLVLSPTKSIILSKRGGKTEISERCFTLFCFNLPLIFLVCEVLSQIFDIVKYWAASPLKSLCVCFRNGCVC